MEGKKKKKPLNVPDIALAEDVLEAQDQVSSQTAYKNQKAETI